MRSPESSSAHSIRRESTHPKHKLAIPMSIAGLLVLASLWLASCGTPTPEPCNPSKTATALVQNVQNNAATAVAVGDFRLATAIAEALAKDPVPLEELCGTPGTDLYETSTPVPGFQKTVDAWAKTQVYEASHHTPHPKHENATATPTPIFDPESNTSSDAAATMNLVATDIFLTAVSGTKISTPALTPGG